LLNATVKTILNGSQNYPFAHYTMCNAITIKNTKNGSKPVPRAAEYEFAFVFGVVVIPA
jgi:hypothetical protein